MIVKVTSKGQITLPSHALEALGVRPGDELELLEDSTGFHLRPKESKSAKGEKLDQKNPPGIPAYQIFDYLDDTTKGRVGDGNAGKPHDHSGSRPGDAERKAGRKLNIVTVSTGNSAPWSRRDIYGDDGR